MKARKRTSRPKRLLEGPICSAPCRRDGEQTSPCTQTAVAVIYPEEGGRCRHMCRSHLTDFYHYYKDDDVTPTVRFL